MLQDAAIADRVRQAEDFLDPGQSGTVARPRGRADTMIHRKSANEELQIEHHQHGQSRPEAFDSQH
jgi:hypothetical protein